MVIIKVLKKSLTKTLKVFLMVAFLSLTLIVSFSKNINVSAAEGPTIYFNLSLGNVTITATTYEGYNEYGTEISGTHSSNNNYYVFQSYEGWNYSEHGIPQYDRVKYNDQSWGDYITNNTNVNEIASQWSAVATAVGRESTPYYIAITGNSTYNITIDNLWSTMNEGSTSRKTGGISFIPSKGGQAIIKLKGDTRFGNIHYNYYSYESTTDKTSIVFENGDSNENQATLTVISYNGRANHYNAVIGGNDSSGHSCGMIFNSGIIYAGTQTKASYTGGGQVDNCSAIGGGGNDTGIIEINGATVTAVASTTGAAIGGGIGESSTGGRGIVTITRGNVYAYNFGYVTFSGGIKYPVPAAAIGGASSREKDGNTGKVTITGGNVYAESIGGAAIGGGSSTKNNGGAAEITIGGTANVIAKSVAGIVNGVAVAAGASIGGGTGGSLGSGSGGKAELTINGGTIKTGSIGGGACTNSSGKIGHAIVNINGGVVQGQIVMAAGANEACSFSMTGGFLDNSQKTEDFIFLHSNGGAVYMNDPKGVASISGGSIQGCSAINGGAIYMTDGTFNMSGTGRINNCSATENGGAVYLGGGEVNISGGSITYCEAINGGAIYMTAGNYYMSGEGSIVNCEAVQNGGALYLGGGEVNISGGTIRLCSATNGGGLSLTGGSVTMTGGTITENTATNNGGGINVNGGNVQMSGSSEISYNKATQSGGGLYITNGNFVMVGGLLTNNQAINGSGGGAYISTSGLDVEAKILSGTVQGNIANISGGALSIVGTGSEIITVQVGVNEKHYDNEGNLIPCNHGIDYGLVSEACPEILNNSANISGGGVYISGSVTTKLNIYCIVENGNKAEGEDESNSDFMMIEGGAVKISATSPENDSDYTYGHNIINGSMHLTGGQMSIEGSMNNPMINGSITVDIVDGSTDYFEDSRPADDDYCKIQYFENFSDSSTGTATGQYTIFQLHKGDSYTIQGSIYYREGYQISGWNTQKDGSGTTYEVGVSYILQGDLILYAAWESHCYYIVYDNGAPDGVLIEGIMERALVSYNEEYNLDNNEYFYKGHIFKHWVWGDIIFADGQLIHNLSSDDGTIITLTAVWEVCEHIDTFVYTADGAVLTKTCTCMAFSETITIKVPMGIVYDGLEHPASLSSTNLEWMAQYTIVYTKNGVEATPINAGEYTASITHGDVTAYAIFVIEKAEQSAPSTPVFEVVGDILTVSEMADSPTTGARVKYQLAHQTAEVWYYPEFVYERVFTLELAYTNYNIFVVYEETENYKQSLATMAIKVYYFSGNVVIHIDNDLGLMATAKEDTENSRLIINVDPQQGYYLHNVNVIKLDGSDEFTSSVQNNNLIYLTDIATESTIKIKVTGAVIKATINSAISPNEVFTNFHTVETRITNDSSFTAYFEVFNYVSYTNLRLTFNENLTVGTSLIMIDKADNSYWYINLNSATNVVAIDDFIRMGGSDTYNISTTNFRLQFVINLGSKMSGISNLNIALDADIELGNDTTPELVEQIEELEMNEAEFSFVETTDVNASGLEKTFDIQFGESTYNSSEWDERSASIIISKVGDIVLPKDLKIIIEATVGAVIKSAMYSVNENGEYIIPLEKGTTSIKLTLSSNLFPNNSQNYLFNIGLYAADTLINKAPTNGDLLFDINVTFVSPTKFITGARIESTSRIVEAGGTISLDITINKTNDQTYTMSLMYKSEVGEYVNTGWKFSQENITINSNDPLNYTLNLSLTGQKEGSYCIIVIVKDGENFTVLSVPYYFIVN